MMLMTAVQSRALASYGYEDGVLAIEMPNGHIYHYRDVPEKTMRAFTEAPSKGSFYAHEIKGQFPSTKLTGICRSCGDIGLIGAPCTDCGCATYTGTLRSTEHGQGR